MRHFCASGVPRLLNNLIGQKGSGLVMSNHALGDRRLRKFDFAGAGPRG
jgi:hypothetical protein